MSRDLEVTGAPTETTPPRAASSVWSPNEHRSPPQPNPLYKWCDELRGGHAHLIGNMPDASRYQTGVPWSRCKKQVLQEKPG